MAYGFGSWARGLTLKSIPDFLEMLKMLDRCERCGANLALVGRMHRRVTKMPEPVTKNVTKKRG